MSSVMLNNKNSREFMVVYLSFVVIEEEEKGEGIRKKLILLRVKCNFNDI